MQYGKWYGIRRKGIFGLAMCYKSLLDDLVINFTIPSHVTLVFPVAVL
jgi:hypothetical protein